MKKNFLNSFKQYSLCIVLILVSCLTGCEKYGSYISYGKKGFTNTNDDSTTAVKGTVPRIELTNQNTKITVYLSVTDQNGNPFTEFNEYNFTIQQVCKGSTDTTLVKDVTFSSMNQQGKNVAVAATMDYSGSMVSSDITQMEAALSDFVKYKNSADYIEIIKFSSGDDVVQAFTNDAASLQSALVAAYPGIGGSTAFFDAIYTGLTDCTTLISSKTGLLPAVIAFTDGNENNSQVSFTDVITLAQNNQIPIYSIGYGSVNQQIMGDLASMTGGRYSYTPDATQLKQLYSMISGQLKNIYQVSWSFVDPGCDEVQVIVKTTYTCKNGTYVSYTTKSFFPK
jgi:Ca-activated chloride channel family protein